MEIVRESTKIANIVHLTREELKCHKGVAFLAALYYCSVQDGLFDVPRSRTVFGSRAFSIATRRQAWNQLPAGIRNTATYSTFEHHPKSFSFTVAYDL